MIKKINNKQWVVIIMTLFMASIALNPNHIEKSFQAITKSQILNTVEIRDKNNKTVSIEDFHKKYGRALYINTDDKTTYQNVVDTLSFYDRNQNILFTMTVYDDPHIIGITTNDKKTYRIKDQT